MATVCVEIEIADDGSVSVGVCPPDEETGEPKDYMQPAKSLDDALGTARDLLANPQQTAQANGDEMAAMMRGYKGPAKRMGGEM